MRSAVHLSSALRCTEQKELYTVQAKTMNASFMLYKTPNLRQKKNVFSEKFVNKFAAQAFWVLLHTVIFHRVGFVDNSSDCGDSCFERCYSIIVVLILFHVQQQ